MAHILAGFVQRRPALIEEGSLLLQSRGSVSAPSSRRRIESPPCNLDNHNNAHG